MNKHVRFSIWVVLKIFNGILLLSNYKLNKRSSFLKKANNLIIDLENQNFIPHHIGEKIQFIDDSIKVLNFYQSEIFLRDRIKNKIVIYVPNEFCKKCLYQDIEQFLVEDINFKKVILLFEIGDSQEIFHHTYDNVLFSKKLNFSINNHICIFKHTDEIIDNVFILYSWNVESITKCVKYLS